MTHPIQTLVLIICFVLFQPQLALAQSDTLLAQQRYDEGKTLYHSGHYDDALQAFSTSLDIRKKYFPAQHPLIIKTMWRMADTESQLRRNDRALAIYEAILKQSTGEDDETTADLYMDIGNVYDQMYEPEKATATYKKVLTLYGKVYGEQSSKTGNVWMNIGGSTQKMGRYQEAEKYLLQAFEIFKKSSDPESVDFNRIYNNLGYMYRKMGDLPKSLQYAEKALDIKLKNYPPDHPSVAKYHMNIGRVYQEMKQPEKALPYYKRALEIEEKALGSNHPSTAGSMGELAGLYADMKEYPKALSLYRKAQKIMLKTRDEQHPYVIAGYDNIATIYAEMGRYKEALPYFDKAWSLLNSRNYVPGMLLAQVEKEKADLYFDMDDPVKALYWYREALKHLAPGFSPSQKDFYSNPKAGQVQNNVQFIEVLLGKSEALEYQAKGSDKRQELLQQSLESVHIAIQVVDYMRKTYMTDESRLYLRSETAPLYRSAVRLSFSLFHLTDNPAYFWKALDYVEQSQANVLRQSLQDAYALQTAMLPKPLLQQLEKLGSQIAQLESDLEDADSADPEANRRLIDLQLQHTALIESLEKDFPDYYALKYAVPSLDPVRLQAKLPDDHTALCIYFYDDTQVYIFLVRKWNIAAYVRPFGDSEFQAIQSIQAFDPQTLISGQGAAAPFDYIAALNTLYSTLLEPIAAELHGTTHLRIVPNGILQYLPFEMLAPASAERDFRRLPYLMRNMTVQYLWSAGLWLQQQPETKHYQRALLGLAPGFQNAPSDGNSLRGNMDQLSALTALPFSDLEVRTAQQYFQGEVLQGDAATKKAFLEMAPYARILHLATHAITDDLHPALSGLYFASKTDSQSNNILHINELYQLHLPAQLAIISACNAGFGQIAEGEGVLSLGRGFRYAGCRSILMNLWLANDRATATLIGLYYQNLAAGQLKDEALRNAKLSYLQQADPLTAHPFFWAGLVGVGDAAALPAESGMNNWWIWVLLGALVVGFAVWYGWFKKRK